MFKFGLRYSRKLIFLKTIFIIDHFVWSIYSNGSFFFFFFKYNIIRIYANNRGARERDDISVSKFKSYFRATFVDTR